MLSWDSCFRKQDELKTGGVGSSQLVECDAEGLDGSLGGRSQLAGQLVCASSHL